MRINVMNRILVGQIILEMDYVGSLPLFSRPNMVVRAHISNTHMLYAFKDISMIKNIEMLLTNWNIPFIIEYFN